MNSFNSIEIIALIKIPKEIIKVGYYSVAPIAINIHE